MSTHAPAHTSLATAHQTAARHRAVPKLNTRFEQTKLHLGTTSAAHHSSGSGGSIMRTIVALVIVIAVIYGLTWIVRKLKSKEGGPASGDGLERIAQLSLGTNRSVALVRVGTELHLLGVADHTVTGIRTFTEDEAIDLGLPVTPPGRVFSSGSRDGDDSGPLTRFGPGGVGAGLDRLRKLTQR